jgi:F-type H+-transporting ATPase subunit b
MGFAQGDNGVSQGDTMPNNMTAIVHAGRVVSIRVTGGETTSALPRAQTTATEASTTKDPQPLDPDYFELAWAGGSFLVLLALMRYVLYPKVAGTMAARNGFISTTLAESDAIRDGAHAEVAEYQADLSSVHAEASARIDTARQTVEAERTARLAAVSAKVGEQRAAAAAATAASKDALSGQIAGATHEVATAAATMLLGASPSADAVQVAVASAMAGGN